MGKYSGSATTARPKGVTATGTPTRTFEGGRGFSLDARTELFTLATTSFMAEKSFYETAGKRDERFVNLVHTIAAEEGGPIWLARFIPWLRGEANMRSASVVAAVELARALTTRGTNETGVSGRRVLAASLQRADEPAEALAYFMSNYGRSIPAAVKRGIADAATRLYTPYGVTKYDPKGAAMRPGDVIALVHPRPKDLEQSELFTYVQDVRHGRDDPRIGEHLSQIAEMRAWHRDPSLDRLPELITWEAASSHFPMDADAWHALIPHMGYMALLRNLRNFEQAGISGADIARVGSILATPDAVAKSRQLPFRFWSAYKSVGTSVFLQYLEEAMELSVKNVPHFAGRTLILVDTSGSMSWGRYSQRGTMNAVQAAALFGAAVTARSDDADIWVFATDAARCERPPQSIMRIQQYLVNKVNSVGSGTNIDHAVRRAVNANSSVDRIFIFTDMQAHPSHLSINDMVPKSTPIHVWDLSGHGKSNIELGSGRYLHAGLSDQSFKTVQLLEAFKPGQWPWDI